MSESRAALLAAAAEEFARFGLHGARIKGIVARAGVNERMIYHHFGSKEGLYGAVMDEQRILLGTNWFPILEKVSVLEPAEGMRGALRGLLDLLTERPQTAALFVQELLTGWHGKLVPKPEHLPAPMRDLYERGQREGAFRLDVPFETAYGFAIGTLVSVAAFSDRFVKWAVPDTSPDEQTLRSQVIDQLIDGMSGPIPKP